MSVNSLKTILVLILSLLSTCLFSQNIDSLELKANLKFLASDEMKGRKILTIENEIATKFIATKLEEKSLEPCFGNSFYVPFDYKKQTIYNVCGKKPGKSNKIIIVSAHFDHIGENKELEGGDQIFNGADDNASGVAAVIGVAEYVKHIETDKTIWFVGFNAEEFGLIGSKEFVKNESTQKELGEVVAVFNFEMLGTISEFGGNKVFMTGDDKSDFDEIINEIQTGSFEIVADPYKKYNLFDRSDNAPFAKEGIIAHSFSSCDITSPLQYYHGVNDEIDLIHFENFTNLVNSLGKTVEIFANQNLIPKYH